jgi:hypothetical protein
MRLRKTMESRGGDGLKRRALDWADKVLWIKTTILGESYWLEKESTP